MHEDATQAWYDQHVAPSSKQRARLAVHVVPSTRAAELGARVGRGIQRASSLDLMKRGWKVRLMVTQCVGIRPAAGAHSGARAAARGVQGCRQDCALNTWWELVIALASIPQAAHCKNSIKTQILTPWRRILSLSCSCP